MGNHVGRPFKEDNVVKLFSIAFRGREEVELFDKVCQKAKEMDVPVKMVFIAGLQRFVEGEPSISNLLGDYIQVKSEKIKIVKIKKEKQKKLTIKEHIESQSWYDSK